MENEKVMRRHLDTEERNQLRAMVLEVGPSEVIRTVANLVGHLIEDDRLADSVRMDLNQSAKRLNGKALRI